MEGKSGLVKKKTEIMLIISTIFACIVILGVLNYYFVNEITILTVLADGISIFFVCGLVRAIHRLKCTREKEYIFEIALSAVFVALDIFNWLNKII